MTLFLQVLVTPNWGNVAQTSMITSSSAELQRSYYQAKFQQSRLHSFQENANIKAFAKAGNTSVISLKSYTKVYLWPYPPKRVTLILFMKFWFLHTCKRAFIFFSSDTKIMQICLQVQKLLINQSGYHREFHSEKLGGENSFCIQQYYSSYNSKGLKLS